MKLMTIAAATALLAASLAANAAEPAAEATAGAPTEPAAANAADPNCLQETGSRIKRDASQPCIAAAGQVISREQLDRTGAVTTADALRRASPAVH